MKAEVAENVQRRMTFVCERAGVVKCKKVVRVLYKIL